MTRGLWSVPGSQLCMPLFFLYIKENTERSLICGKSLPSSCENLSPCCIYFEQTSSVNTEAILPWLLPDGCFLSLMRITPSHLSLVPWLLRLQLAAVGREEI